MNKSYYEIWLYNPNYIPTLGIRKKIKRKLKQLFNKN